MTKSEAKQITGGLSHTAKMPCPSYGLPALASCPVGAKLATVPGSICASCYALKGQYRFSNVQAAQRRRMEATKAPQWVEAMVTLISGMPWFRWHDSGDLYSYEYALRVLEVCRLTPETRHWIPTRQKSLVIELQAQGLIPDNVTMRLSAPMIGGLPSAMAQDMGIPTSTVHNDRTGPWFGHKCNAPEQNGECRACRACWGKTTRNVSYHQH